LSPQQSSRIVVICALIETIFVLTHAHLSSQSTEKTIKSLWAIGALAFGLAIFSDFLPQVAGPFALLVLVALAARQRGEIGTVLGTATSSSAAGSSTPPAAGGASTSHPSRTGGGSPGGPSRTGQ
jgi:hypothetical protein